MERVDACADRGTGKTLDLTVSNVLVCMKITVLLRVAIIHNEQSTGLVVILDGYKIVKCISYPLRTNSSDYYYRYPCVHGAGTLDLFEVVPGIHFTEISSTVGDGQYFADEECRSLSVSTVQSTRARNTSWYRR